MNTIFLKTLALLMLISLPLTSCGELINSLSDAVVDRVNTEVKNKRAKRSTVVNKIKEIAEKPTRQNDDSIMPFPKVIKTLQDTVPKGSLIFSGELTELQKREIHLYVNKGENLSLYSKNPSEYLQSLVKNKIKFKALLNTFHTQVNTFINLWKDYSLDSTQIDLDEFLKSSGLNILTWYYADNKKFNDELVKFDTTNPQNSDLDLLKDKNLAVKMYTDQLPPAILKEFLEKLDKNLYSYQKEQFKSLNDLAHKLLKFSITLYDIIDKIEDTLKSQNIPIRQVNINSLIKIKITNIHLLYTLGSIMNNLESIKVIKL